jgi:transcriptional regulator with XRE-family HTH domain
MSTPSFGDLIRQTREQAGWSQNRVAQRAGLSTVNVSHIEQGIVKRPRLATVVAIARVLELTPDQCFRTIEGS